MWLDLQWGCAGVGCFDWWGSSEQRVPGGESLEILVYSKKVARLRWFSREFNRLWGASMDEVVVWQMGKTTVDF